MADYDSFSSGEVDGAEGVPYFAVDENLSSGRERRLGDANFTDQSLFAGRDFVSSGANGDGHEESGDGSQRDADGRAREQ